MASNSTLETNAVHRIGYISAISLVAITLITFALALTAIPISGANAPDGGLGYPYLDTLSQFPKYYWWIFTAYARAHVLENGF